MAYDNAPPRRPQVANLVLIGLSVLLGGCIVNVQPPQTTIAQAAAVDGSIDHSQPRPPGPVLRGAPSGKQQRVEFFLGLHPDCTSTGIPTAHVVTPPAHGTVNFAEGQEYSGFPPGNQRHDCNKQKSPALDAFYTSAPDYKGGDEFGIEVLYPSGAIVTRRFIMTVE